MSILDGLPIAENTDYAKTVWLDDVREALTNPTDEQVDALTRMDSIDAALGEFLEYGEDASYFRFVRAVLAAAAGGDE